MCAFDEIICDRFFVIGIGDQAAVFGGNSSRYDAARPRKIFDRHFCGCLLHVETPDGCGDFSAGLTVQRAVAIKADPDRGGDVRRITDEPGIFVLIGGALYELNRQIISTQMYDIGGSNTIFMFGGLMGTVVAFFLAFTKQKD